MAARGRATSSWSRPAPGPESYERDKQHPRQGCAADRKGVGLQAAKLIFMDSSGHLPVSESAARRMPRGKAKGRGNRSRRPAATAEKTAERPQAAVGTLTRTKSLLLAALRVWELKQRIGE